MIKATEATAIVNRIKETDLYKKTEEDVSRKIEEAAIEGKNGIEVEVMMSHLAMLAKTLVANGFNIAQRQSRSTSVVKLWIDWPV
jgi:hypothetical protein